MEKSSFFNSVLEGGKPDRVYLAEDFARYFNSFIGNGVFPNPSTSLQVMANDDMTVTLKAGKGWINGYFYVNTDDLVIPIEMADGLRHRIDRVVLRLDLNNRWVKTAVKKGKLSTDPVPPSLQRGDNIYELGLAEVRVGKGDISISQSQIKDTRASSELCGWVAGVVDQVDTETLFRQYEKWFEETTGQADATLTDLFEKYEKWYKDTTGQAEVDLAEIKENFKKDLEEFTDNYTDWFTSFTGESEKEFNEWFENIKDIIDDNVATKLFKEIERVEGLIDDIPPVFHDLPQNAVKESMAPRDFEYGVTLCSQSSVDDFPSVNEYGVSYTLIGRNSNYAQIFITRFGDIWSRRSTVRTGWNGDWYSNKKEIEKKADKNEVGRTSTIVIANYDSHENSKKGADIVINKGENASKKINDAIQSLKGTGGEVKLMEGIYNLEYGIVVNIPNVHLTGIPGATILKQNTNWGNNPINNRKNIIDTLGLESDDVVKISNLYVKGAKISYITGFSVNRNTQCVNCVVEDAGHYGFYCENNSQFVQCTSINAGIGGFVIYGNSQAVNCISKRSKYNGFNAYDDSIVTNCIAQNNGGGFDMYDDSITTNCVAQNNSKDGFTVRGYGCSICNCTTKNNGDRGIALTFSFGGVCSFNTLINDKLSDSSKDEAVVEYNVVKEG